MIRFNSELKAGWVYFSYETEKWVFDISFRLDRLKFGFEWDIHKFKLYSLDTFLGFIRFGIEKVGE